MKNFFLSLLAWFRPQKSDAARIAVQYATLRYLDADKTPGARANRAAKVRAVIDDVKLLGQDGQADAAFIGSLIRSRLPADMPAADRLLVEQLLSTVEVNVGALSLPQQSVKLAEVLGWIGDVLPAR